MTFRCLQEALCLDDVDAHHLSHIAHDLLRLGQRAKRISESQPRNPLSVASLGLTRLRQLVTSAPDSDRVLDMMERALKSLGGLIDSVHSFSQSPIGFPMFFFWAIMTLISVALIIWRWQRGELKSERKFVSQDHYNLWLSRKRYVGRHLRGAASTR